MSRSLRFAAVAVAACAVAGVALADPLGLGRVATEAEIAAWDIDVRPDGQGLPEGAGTVAEGEEIYIAQCATCHGDFGEGAGRWPVLAGGQGSLKSARPVKTVGSYWPYLSTVYDYVHRAMPFGAAQTLSADETYALTAYILYLNDIVSDDGFELNRDNFSDIAMPNVDNFYMDDRESAPLFGPREVCMTDCKDRVEITARAQVIDVTPDDASNPSSHEVISEDEDGDSAAAEQSAAEPATLDQALVETGETVFRKCRSCHKVGEGARNGAGPHLNGLFGRTAGTVDGFRRYSQSMVEAGEGGLVWSDETLDRYLIKPRDMIARSTMAFPGLSDEQDRAAVIEFLKSKQP